MAATLTATAQPATSTVLLVVSGAATSLVSLTRTDANGVRSVRLQSAQVIIGGSLIVQDSEVSLRGPATYSLRLLSGETVTASATLDQRVYRLHPVPWPQWGLALPLVTQYSASRSSATAVHEVIGRADPVVRLSALRTRRGAMTIWCASYTDLIATLDVYRRAEVVMLRQGDYPGMDMYHVATSTTEAGYDEESKRWRLDVEYTEVAVPRGPLLGAIGWTYDTVAATYPTYDTVAATYPTYNALQIGPVT